MSHYLYSILLIFIIGTLLFGSLIKYYYDGGKKYQKIIKIVLFLANIPLIINSIINNRSINPKKPPILTRHKEKKRFHQFIKNNREGLLVLPRYDHSLSRAVVDVIDLNEFKIIHTYKHNIASTSKNSDLIRFGYYHPLIFDDGSLISESTYSPLFKIDFQSNMQWTNDEIVFHHSKARDHENNIWIPARLKPFSKYVKKFQHPINDFRDDAIVKINSEGKILFKKSMIEILIENKKGDMINKLKKTVSDPIHLNCIEPALSDTNHWNKGDLFLSLKHHSAIILYRPIENKIIDYIIGPFAQQHDVDIVSNNEISIFNNNNFFLDNEFSEVLIYNFKTKQFKKLFNEQIKKESFKVSSSGMSQILNDGSLMVEEQTDGRIILFNNKGEKEWEFVNKDKNGNIGEISWSRIIEDKLFIEKFKLLIENKKTIN
jgi:hypothetical protein